jgi:hypothetical protein
MVPCNAGCVLQLNQRATGQQQHSTWHSSKAVAYPAILCLHRAVAHDKVAKMHNTATRCQAGAQGSVQPHAEATCRQHASTRQMHKIHTSILLCRWKCVLYPTGGVYATMRGETQWGVCMKHEGCNAQWGVNGAKPSANSCWGNARVTTHAEGLLLPVPY